MTTPNAINRLSKRERKGVVRLLTAVEEESDGEVDERLNGTAGVDRAFR